MSNEITPIIQALVKTNYPYTSEILDKIILIQLAKLESYTSNTDIELALSNILKLLQMRQDCELSHLKRNRLFKFK